MKKVIYKLATTLDEKDMIAQLRFQGFCHELGWFNPANYPNGREEDEWDNHSFHFLALRDLKIIGTLRLIPSIESEFYTEKFVNFPKEIPRAVCLEVSRLYVIPSERGNQAEVMFGLVKMAREFSLARGYEFWYFLMETTVEKVLGHLGWHLRFLDERRRVKLADDAPASLFVRSALLRLDDKSIRFLK